MLKSDVIDYYRSAGNGDPVGAVARALNIKSSAVSQWPEHIPRLRAYELERLTDGALKVDPDVIPDKAA